MSSTDRSASRSRGRWAVGGLRGPELGELRLLTVIEVAAALRVSKMTVYRLIHAEQLASVRVGKSYRVPERAVQDYLRGSFRSAG